MAVLPGRAGGIAALRELIDQFDADGALTADLRQFYSFNLADVWAGLIPVHTVATFIGQLTAIPHSRVYGLAGGTPELQGWDVATMVATRTHNLIAGLVAGLSKGVDLDRILITVPTPEQPDPEPQTLADFIRTHVDGGALDEFFAP